MMCRKPPTGIIWHLWTLTYDSSAGANNFKLYEDGYVNYSRYRFFCIIAAILRLKCCWTIIWEHIVDGIIDYVRIQPSFVFNIFQRFSVFISLAQVAVVVAEAAEAPAA